MNPIRVLMIASALLLSMIASSVHAADFSGSYKITKDGQLIGGEKFDITFDENGAGRCDSISSIMMSENNTIEYYSQVNYSDPKGQVRDYQREVMINKVPKKLVMTYDGSNALVQINTGINNIQRKIPMHSSAVIMDTGIYNGYHALLRRYSRKLGGLQKLFAFSPSELIEREVWVADKGKEVVSLEDGYYEAQKYFIDLEDEGALIWVDDKGRVVKIKLPMTGFNIEWVKYNGKRAGMADIAKEIIYKVDRENVSFVSGDNTTIAGSVTKPKNSVGKLPAIIWLSRSGPQDRDGNAPAVNLNLGTGEMLDALSEAGYLVLRTDDRGVGESQGLVGQTTLALEEQDAHAAIVYLSHRDDVAPNRIAVIGQEEGAAVAVRVAAKNSEIKSVVLIAPSSITLNELAIRQLKERHKQSQSLEDEDYTYDPLFRAIERSRQSNDKTIIFGGKSINLDIFRQYDKMNPLEEIASLSKPILHIQGGRDVQIFPDLAEKIRTRMANNQGYTYKFFENLDHFLVESRGTIGSYVDPDRHPAKEAISYIIKWLGANL